LHCSFTGDSKNPPLLLLHGFLGNSNDWVSIRKALDSEFYCLALDLPGHGSSRIENFENSYSIENTAKYIIEFLNHKNISKCHLLGYSMGGRIAIYLATKYPQYFKKIIIESGRPGIENDEERNLRNRNDHKLAQKIVQGRFKEFLKFWYDQPIFESLKKHKNYANLLKSRLNNNPQFLAKSLVEIGAGVQPSLWKTLHQIQCPCLLIAGEFDTKYQKIFARMHKEIYSSYFVVIKNSGHNTHFENNVEFIKVVKKFLRH
jgi:2-succinyl-6-hydroxy-2,4-cyclohexadiene-1-carboxylate synthase